MATDQTPAGSARITKTKRVQYSVIAGDITATFVTIDVPWDSPFTDTNYTCDQNVEVVSPADPNGYAVKGFTKFVDKVSVTIGFGAAAAATDVIIVHAHAIKD